MLARETLPAQGDHLVDDSRACWAAQAFGSRGAVGQSGETFCLEAGDPFARGARADACGSCGGLRRLPALEDGAHDPLSTNRRQPGILMDVHPVLREITEASQLQLPRSKPD